MDLAIIKKTEELENQDKNLEDLSENYEKIDEIPFDFKRRRLSTVVKNMKTGKIKMVTKGAVEEMLSVCKYVEEKREVKEITEKLKEKILCTVDELNKKGFRVLALAKKNEGKLNEEEDMILIGYLAFLDPPKESTEAAIKALKKHGVSTKVLTGDNDLVTRTAVSYTHLTLPTN